MENLRKLAKDDEIVDIQVTCDGTWSRRGHQAICCVVVIAAWATGQVIDQRYSVSTVLSAMQREERTLHLKTSWIGIEEYQAQYQVNYYGSSNAMEADGAVVMWQRSIEKYKLRYTCDR